MKLRKTLLALAALAVMGGFDAASGPVRAAELAPGDTAPVVRTGGDLQRVDYDEYCYRHSYGCRDRSRYGGERRYYRYWGDGDWRDRRWRWREWERHRAWWWRHEGRREFCWRHPDHWRCYRDYR
jgi:hypothetical protein